MGETEDEEMNVTLGALQLDCVVVVCLKAQSYLEQAVGFRKNVCQIVFFFPSLKIFFKNKHQIFCNFHNQLQVCDPPPYNQVFKISAILQTPNTK